MRGKAGPKPETKKEAEESKNDPTAEEIVGAENVVDVGATEEAPPEVNAYRCSLAGCKFYSKLLSEMEEHVNGTGHGGYKTEDAKPVAVQPELFRPPGTIRKSIKVPFESAFLEEKRKELATFYASALEVKAEKKSADAGFNARLTTIDEEMQAISRILQSPFTYENQDCEWRIIEGENARGLYRLDTGEQIEKKPLSAEDFAAEQQKAETDNAAPEIDSDIEEEEDVEPEAEMVN